MAGDPRRIYWDSCVFLSWINGIPDRLPHIDWFLDRSGTEHQIITSTFTIAEVAFAELEKTQGALDDEILRRIDALWLAEDSPVKLADVHPAIALEARELARQCIAQQLGTMKGGDAVHLATAKHYGCSEIHTYSKDWPGKARLVGGIPIGPPLATDPEFAFPPHGTVQVWAACDAYPALENVEA